MVGFAKVLQDVVTSAAVRYQLWFWGLTLPGDLFDNFIITFLFGIATGQTSFKFQTFAKPERYARCFRGSATFNRRDEN
jgi:hypothetical protein